MYGPVVVFKPTGTDSGAMQRGAFPFVDVQKYPIVQDVEVGQRNPGDTDFWQMPPESVSGVGAQKCAEPHVSGYSPGVHASPSSMPLHRRTSFRQ